MSTNRNDDLLREVEETQQDLRQSIESSKRLAEHSQTLLNRYKQTKDAGVPA